MSSRDQITRLVRDGVSHPVTNQRVPALALAPMATITHAGFRTLVSEFGGCDLYFTEMISAEALTGGASFESYYRNLAPAPDRTIYQLVGYSASAIVSAARILAGEPCAGIDVNMGCSAPHIVRKGGGIAWMTRPVESARLVATLRELVPDKSLSVKMRLAPTDEQEDLIEFARTIARAGADFVTLHPKRRRDGSARPAKWSFIEKLGEALAVPVMGNGGIRTWSDYLSRSDLADSTPQHNPSLRALMIGRGAVRAPWIFAHIREREAGAPGTGIDLVRTATRFFDLLETFQPPEFWPSRARRFYPYLMQNVQFGHSLGARLAGTRSYPDGKRMLLDALESGPGAGRYVETD